MVKIEKADIYSIKEYSDHLKSLNEIDKYSRFGIKMSDHSIDLFMLSVVYNPNEHYLWTAKVKNKIVGWGHMAQENSSWELAVSVNEDYQKKGIGSKLIEEMLQWAKFNRIEKVYMHCIENNKVIQHLAEKHNLITKSREFGERTAEIELPDPSLFDYNNQLIKEYNEIMHDSFIIKERFSKLFLKNILKKS